MEGETREVVYLSVSLILLAIVLTFAIFGIHTTHQVADVKNTENRKNENIEQYRKFNAYDGKTLIGDDVIEMIRMYYDSDVTIFVDHRSNTATGETVGSAAKCSYCNGKTDLDHRFYNFDLFLLHKDGGSDVNYFMIYPNNIASQNQNDLRNWYPSAARYRSYLVYDSDDILNYYNEIMSYYNSHKGGASTIEDKARVLDAAERPHDVGATVSGIIVIDLNDK